MFTDAIMALLEWIYSRVGDVANGSSGLTMTLDGFSQTLFDWTTAIMNSVAMPVATVLLALFALLEIHSAATNAQNSGSSIPAEIIIKILIKVGLAKLALDSISLIMQAVYQISTYLTENIQTLVTTAGTTTYDLELLRANVESLNFGMQLLMLIVGAIAFLITWIATLFAEILITARFVEIYVYFAMSPIPTATLLNAEQSSTGKNFLKSFGAVCLQGTLIYLVLTFFPVITTGMLSATDDVAGAIMGTLGYSLVLIFSISGTSKWAKTITGTG